MSGKHMTQRKKAVGTRAVTRQRSVARERGMVTLTLDEAQAKVTRGETRTNWNRVKRMTESEVEANALADSDNPPWTSEMLAQARWVEPSKQAVSIRLDSDVLDFIKSEGPGYQSRINAILRTYVAARKAS